MDQIETTAPKSSRMLSWIMGIAVLVFLVVLAWLIAQGGPTTEFFLWTDASMIVVAAAGLILFIIAAIVRPYSR